jgi:hypothetical protein
MQPKYSYQKIHDIDKLNGAHRYFTPNHFESLKSHLDPEWMWLRDMHIALKNIEGGIDFVKNYNDDVYALAHYNIGEQIVKHSLIEKNRHSGRTFGWTFNTLRYIYNNGLDEMLDLLQSKRIEE